MKSASCYPSPVGDLNFLFAWTKLLYYRINGSKLPILNHVHMIVYSRLETLFSSCINKAPNPNFP